MRSRITSFVGLVFLCVCFFGCGKFGPPLPPEAFSPVGVRDLQVFGELQGVRFQWKSPEEDLQGEELESLNGYKIYRKSTHGKSAAVLEEEDFELIQTIVDKSVQDRESRREQARNLGKPSKKIKSNPDLQEFQFVDARLQPGETYLYKIIPVNQGDVEGQVRQMVEILYRGTSSVIRLVEADSFDDLQS